jgi:uncharacterized protein
MAEPCTRRRANSTGIFHDRMARPALMDSSPPHVTYACQRCTNCCRWPGDVKVTDAEIAEIAAFLKLDVLSFIRDWTRVREDRKGLSLLDRADHSCIFLEGRDCAIQPVKPRQCRGFPNAWNFPGWRDVCEAIPLPHAPA